MDNHFDLADVNTAHDVRHLRVCAKCGLLGDKRRMVTSDTRDWWHGRCFIDTKGMNELLMLPTDQLDSLTLGDIGPSVMHAILNTRKLVGPR